MACRAALILTINRISIIDCIDSSLTSRLRHTALQCGAIAVGFAPCGSVHPADARRFGQWLDSGCHGEMAYMASHCELRLDPRGLLDGAVSVMVCAFPYYHPEKPSGLQFAMYAHGDDYHEVLRRRLEPVVSLLASEGRSHRICVDSAPVLERYWAVRAGVGVVGRNRLLFVPGYGSYIFLAEILTDAQLEPSIPPEQASQPEFSLCGSCTRCVVSCPGGALRHEGGFDARSCLSYLTIEYRGNLPAMLQGKPLSKLLGRCVYGCDVCQAVCPLNAPLHSAFSSQGSVAPLPEFCLRPSLRKISRSDILAMDAAAFSTIFRHSPVKRLKLAGLQRNASALNPS